ncbi:hypothetical protein [Microbacterium sp. NPDC087665]|uniref:hypothetical protein n=1 Tax=Microbacterium sp. NPDC087665 TaxID=3364194 RepID=UPI00381BF742
MRSVRLRLAVALGGVAALTLSMFGALALPESATAAPIPGSDAPVIEMSLEPHFPGEPSWPSTYYPTFALLIDLTDASPEAGETIDIELSSNLTAATVPGSIFDADGTELLTYAVSSDSRRITLTYSEAAAAVVDLHASLAVFVSTDSLVPGGSAVTADATVGDTVFPLSAAYTGLPWSENSVVGTWETGPTGALRFIARPTVEAHPEYAAAGGQWIGVGTAEGWPGVLTPAPGTTRVFHLEQLPESLTGFTDPAAELERDVDYVLDEQTSSDGQPVFGISVTTPTSGYFVIEQTYDLVSTGAVLFEAPNADLPAPARQVFAAGTRIITGAVDAHLGGSSGIGGISATTFLASSGGTASASAMEPEMTAARSVTPASAPAGEAKGTVSLTLTNTGNTPLDVTYSDEVTATASQVTVRDASASSGTASADADTVSWSGRLAPGAEATVTYAYDARATGTQIGALVFSGTGRGAVSSNPQLSATPAIADAEVAVSALPVETAAATAPPTSDGALATTGADGSSAAALTALAFALCAGGILAMRSRRRA